MLLRFVRKNLVSITLLSLLVTSFLLMSLDVKKQGGLNIFEEFLIDSASMVQRSATYAYQSGRDIWYGYIYLIGMGKENQVLKKEVAELRERASAMQEVAQENKRLRELLSFKEETGYRTVTARVIGRGPTNIFKTLTIGAGSAEGIKKGMAVMTNEGVVGRVVNTSANTSRVLLITDRNSDIDAVIQRSRDRGIAEGRDPDTLQLKYLSRSADAAEGDLVVTSGVGGIFPKGLIIGSVSMVDGAKGGIFLYAEVKPAVTFSKLEEVLVITDSPQWNEM